jgi:hypothetical protein
MVEEGGEITLEEKEEVMLEVEEIAVLKTLVEEEKVKIIVSQVVRELKNQRFSAITIKSMDNMHICAGRDNIIKTSNVKINQITQITKLTLCLWHAMWKFL